MNIKPIIVKSYLESLTEERELNRIFPMLLSSLGFEILTKPTENKGLPEYGKDVVAVGKDKDGTKKRFYFELKGGEDRNITPTKLTKTDGIIESLREAKYANFETTYKDFDTLPQKIVLVHNGELKGSARKTYKDFISKEFPVKDDIEFERWDIERLSIDFSEHLFGAYLFIDQNTTKKFNKVIINLNASSHISEDFIRLIDELLSKNEWHSWKKKKRQWKLLFETLKLISFIIYTESKEYNNLDIAKRYLTHIVLKFWHWILKNKLENDTKIKGYFDEVLNFYFSVLAEYFKRTLTIAQIQDGLSYENSGRYEQIGYTKRTFEYLEYLTFLLTIDISNPKVDKSEKTNIKEILSSVINSNSVSLRPLVDINSLPIVDILNIYLLLDDKLSATNYLKGVLSYIMNGKKQYGRMPDANNSYENVIRFTITNEKPVYYSDSTSPLLSVLLEYVAILDLEDEYNEVRKFIIHNKIDLGIFTPHHGKKSISKHLIENTTDDLEEQLFSNPRFNDGYQRDIKLFVDLHEDMSFENFKLEYEKRADEFEYDYRTDKAGYFFLRNLAHIYFQIPYFPDKWRRLQVKTT